MQNSFPPKKKIIKVEIKKRFTPLKTTPIAQQPTQEPLTEPIKTIKAPVQVQEPPQSIETDIAQITAKLKQNDIDFRRALFLGDKTLVNKIQAEQIEYKKALMAKQQAKHSGSVSTAPRYPRPYLNPRPAQSTAQSFTYNPRSQVPGQFNRFSTAPKGDTLRYRYQRNLHGDSEDKAPQKRVRQKKAERQILSKEILITGTLELRELAAAMCVTAKEVINKLRELDIKANQETIIEIDIAEFLIKEFGHTSKIKDNTLQKVKMAITADNLNAPDVRAPVVAVVGHVDHGKTSLLDALRKTNVTAKESGGITQSIGASQVYLDKDFVTFIDTPGHKLFMSMRAKGMSLTDIILLVVAADDGVKEQTIESIKFAKSTSATLIVVITKADKAAKGDVEKIRRSLLNQDIVVEGMGGNVAEILVSTRSGENIKELLELIILTGQMLNLRANNSSAGYAKILDSYLDKFQGPIANIIVYNGTIKRGDYFLCGTAIGKIKSIHDWKGQSLNEAKPAFPAQVSGFESIVMAGEELLVTKNQAEAKTAALEYQKGLEKKKEIKVMLYSVEDIWKKLVGEPETDEIRFVIRADSDASAEALAAALTVTDSDKINRTVISAGVGAVTESDLQMAKAAEARIIAFKVDVPVIKTATNLKVNVKKYDIIYKILEDLEEEIEAMFAPKEVLTEIGKAEIRKVFMKPKPIAGCIVLDGVIKRNCIAAVIRNGEEIWRGKIISMKQVKDDIKEAKKGQECGIFMHNFEEYQAGDTVKCFEVVQQVCSN